MENGIPDNTESGEITNLLMPFNSCSNGLINKSYNLDEDSSGNFEDPSLLGSREYNNFSTSALITLDPELT